MSAEIVARAPGKLYIAGEYAVVTPGEPAVLVAVDRSIRVRLTESVGAGSIHSPEFGRTPLTWTRSDDGIALDREHHPYDYVFAAITVAERLRHELGLAARFFDLRIDSGLDDTSGRKFGLGSSAAVTVATLKAIDAFYGFGLDLLDLCRLAILATIRVAPAASGGDVAASTFGGWIGYRSPDRAALLAAEGSLATLLRDEQAWAGFEVSRLPPPDRLKLLVGWTGVPASTERLVQSVTGAGAVDDTRLAAFRDASRLCVLTLWGALEDGDDRACLDAIRRARVLLRELGTDAGVAIETQRLRALCDLAERAGAAGKPSGAGGGDCGIVLAPDAADVDALVRAWEDDDIRRLTLAVHPPEGSIRAH